MCAGRSQSDGKKKNSVHVTIVFGKDCIVISVILRRKKMKGVTVSRTREGNVSMSLSVTNGRKNKNKNESLCHQLIGAYGRKN